MILCLRCAKRDVVAITHAFRLQRNLSARVRKTVHEHNQCSDFHAAHLS